MLSRAQSLRLWASPLAGAATSQRQGLAGLLAAPGLPDPAAAGHPSPTPALSPAFSLSPSPFAPYSSHAAASSLSNNTDSNSSASSSSSNPVQHKYQALLADGTLKPDEQQAALVQRLGRLYDEVVDYRRRMDGHAAATTEYQVCVEGGRYGTTMAGGLVVL